MYPFPGADSLSLFFFYSVKDSGTDKENLPPVLEEDKGRITVKAEAESTKFSGVTEIYLA